MAKHTTKDDPAHRGKTIKPHIRLWPITVFMKGAIGQEQVLERPSQPTAVQGRSSNNKEST